MTLILGIDPGLQSTGWGIVERVHDVIRYVDSGLIQENTSMPDAKRLFGIYKAMRDVCKRFKPVYGGIEITYVNQNKRSSLKLAQARAAAMIACAEHSVILEEFDAKQVKRLISGNGNADKMEVISALAMRIVGWKNSSKTSRDNFLTLNLSRQVNVSDTVITQASLKSLGNSFHSRYSYSKKSLGQKIESLECDISKKNDESDALAIAVCRLYTLNDANFK